MNSLKNWSIERVQVDEGFLDGLDLRLGRGLTVIIGARGTGKTSLVELVRFCLGADSFTDEARERGHQQALSVLDGGQVTVTLSDGQDRTTVMRSASDPAPRATSEMPDVTILAQNEIEAVGAQSGGRLRLVDRLVPERRDFDRTAERLRAEIKSLTLEIRDLLVEVDDMHAVMAEGRHVPDELGVALGLEESVLESVKATEADRTELTNLQNVSAQTKVQQGVFERALGKVQSMDTDLERMSSRPILTENWPEAAGDHDMMSPLRAKVSVALRHLQEARRVLASTVKDIESNINENVAKTIGIDQASREIRKRLDQLEEGIGAITRRVSELREKAGQLSALHQRVNEKRSHAVLQAERRDDLYRALDNLRQERFASRHDIAESLTRELGPGIQVAATRSEQTRPYADAIISGLRGSGLHYNTLGPQIAGSMSPLELIQAVELRDPERIAEAADISPQRALAVVETLRQSDLASILAAPIDDGITLELLDGSVFKNSVNVSIGQRCTTVLPVLLAQHGGILMVDQPEDHLDNSFIASTVVTALQQRHANDQLIFASHNANIPVLGDADLIVVLDSDGKRGFVKHTGSLEESDSVRAITDIMEGGVEAFARRSEFYSASAGRA